MNLGWAGRVAYYLGIGTLLIALVNVGTVAVIGQGLGVEVIRGTKVGAWGNALFKFENGSFFRVFFGLPSVDLAVAVNNEFSLILLGAGQKEMQIATSPQQYGAKVRSWLYFNPGDLPSVWSKIGTSSTFKPAVYDRNSAPTVATTDSNGEAKWNPNLQSYAVNPASTSSQITITAASYIVGITVENANGKSAMILAPVFVGDPTYEKAWLSGPTTFSGGVASIPAWKLAYAKLTQAGDIDFSFQGVTFTPFGYYRGRGGYVGTDIDEIYSGYLVSRVYYPLERDISASNPLGWKISTSPPPTQVTAVPSYLQDVAQGGVNVMRVSGGASKGVITELDCYTGPNDNPVDKLRTLINGASSNGAFFNWNGVTYKYLKKEISGAQSDLLWPVASSGYGITPDEMNVISNSNYKSLYPTPNLSSRAKAIVDKLTTNGFTVIYIRPGALNLADVTSIATSSVSGGASSSTLPANKLAAEAMLWNQANTWAWWQQQRFELGKISYGESSEAERIALSRIYANLGYRATWTPDPTKLGRFIETITPLSKAQTDLAWSIVFAAETNGLTGGGQETMLTALTYLAEKARREGKSVDANWVNDLLSKLDSSGKSWNRDYSHYYNSKDPTSDSTSGFVDWLKGQGLSNFEIGAITWWGGTVSGAKGVPLKEGYGYPPGSTELDVMKKWMKTNLGLSEADVTKIINSNGLAGLLPYTGGSSAGAISDQPQANYVWDPDKCIWEPYTPRTPNLEPLDRPGDIPGVIGGGAFDPITKLVGDPLGGGEPGPLYALIPMTDGGFSRMVLSKGSFMRYLQATYSSLQEQADAFRRIVSQTLFGKYVLPYQLGINYNQLSGGVKTLSLLSDQTFKVSESGYVSVRVPQLMLIRMAGDAVLWIHDLWLLLIPVSLVVVMVRVRRRIKKGHATR